MTTTARSSFKSLPGALTAALLVLCLPWGWLRLRQSRVHTFWLVTAGLLGLPVFLSVYILLGLLLFAAFLPLLDLGMGPNLPRTIRNNGGNYESTFLETGRETGGAHELIRVQIQPKGGNIPHYHREFEETFTTLSGVLTIHDNGTVIQLRPGESHTVPRGHAHWFRNDTAGITEMMVRVTPAHGLEKSLRVTYGLANHNGWQPNGLTRNPWHMPLLLGYSDTYLTGLPGFVQEPLVGALARIAQWRGEDRDLKRFFE